MVNGRRLVFGFPLSTEYMYSVGAKLIGPRATNLSRKELGVLDLHKIQEYMQNLFGHVYLGLHCDYCVFGQFASSISLTITLHNCHRRKSWSSWRVNWQRMGVWQNMGGVTPYTSAYLFPVVLLNG